MKKLMLSITLILLFIITVNINVKADSDSWYIPDLQDYTFIIPKDSDDFRFRFIGITSGDFKEFARASDFGVSQTSSGALDFSNLEYTLNEVVLASILLPIYGEKLGLTPMSLYTLPSYVSYNIYSTYDHTEYPGAVDIHVITYRLDFMGNYSMLLDDYVYDIAYSLEVKYELNLDYINNDYELYKDYTIHWYDITDMEEHKLSIPMSTNLIEIQLKKIGDSDGGYDVGYDDGYVVGFKDGEKSKIAKNNESFYNSISIWIPAVITVIALASILPLLVFKRKE